MLIEQDWKGASLDKLIETQLAPFVGTDTMRIETTGPQVTLAAGAVQTLGLALHELATNASKYGALSAPGGRVVLSWGFDDGGSTPKSFRMEWREQGGPPVKPSKRKGFGRFVTDQMVTRALNATVENRPCAGGIAMDAADARKRGSCSGMIRSSDAGDVRNRLAACIGRAATCGAEAGCLSLRRHRSHCTAKPAIQAITCEFA